VTRDLTTGYATADTIATMGGALAGALQGVDGIRSDWVAKARRVSSVDQEELALRLTNAALMKHEQEGKAHSLFERILVS
jgi:hypothetical protein